jgi:regulator of protease activity HflC (stomatin/prohibitin superfamily)
MSGDISIGKGQKPGGLLVFIIAGSLLLIGGLIAFHWTVNRVYVDPGESLMLRYKGPLVFGKKTPAPAGSFAQEGEIGVLANMRGPGRHFYCPIWWERKVVKDVIVEIGEVAIITSKLGDALPVGQFLVDGKLGETTHKGILRKVYGPGRYRVHPYAYSVNIVRTQEDNVSGQLKTSGWVDISAGYVGVVTYLTDNPVLGKKAGIQDEVLPPGLYAVNPREMQIDIVEIGYREISIIVDKQLKDGQPMLDESGEPLPVPETGINFPSNDGFEIQMDFTAIWGVMPDEASDIVRTFGDINAVEQKVILPQSESICRNAGSRLGAVELLVGDSRQQFQLDISDELNKQLEAKHLTLLYGLVRHIYIPRDVRLPIQNSFIADELTLTREQERITATTEANLREAEKKVELEAERIRAETVKLVANVSAEGEKTAKQIAAETEQLVAAIERKIAELDAKRTVLLGEAEAGALKLAEEARANKFTLAVSAFGDGRAYSQWQFAEGLPNNIELKLFYAGDGTLWTDLERVMPTLNLNRGAK